MARTPHPLFEPIRRQIVAARDKLRREAVGATKAEFDRIHRRFDQLAEMHKVAGCGKLDNIKAGGPKKPGGPKKK